MSLFVCSKCKCIENTALSSYWEMVTIKHKNPICSECDSRISKWHGKFKKENVEDWLRNNPGRKNELRNYENKD